MDTTDFTVELPVDELLERAIVAGRFVELDERVAAGNVRLTADGRHRTWRVSTDAVMLELRGGTDPARYDLLVPSRLLNATAAVAAGGPTVTLATGRHFGRPASELRGPGGVVTVTTHSITPPSSDAHLGEEGTAATARIDCSALHEALRLAMQVPYGFDGERNPWPAMSWSIASGVLELAVDWGAFGAAVHVVPATTSGEGEAWIMPGAMAALLDAFDGDEIAVKLPKLPSDPVELSADGWIGSVPQVDFERDWPADAEEVILEAFGEEAASEHNGVYLLASEPFVRARFSAEPPWRLEVSAVVLTDVAPSPDLLAELNDHNHHLGMARVAWENGSVVMRSDLLIASLDAAALRMTVRWIGEHTSRLAPVLATVFAGRDPNVRPQESR